MMTSTFNHRTGLKDVTSESMVRDRDRRSRMSQELRKDARSRLISAKRARPNPHQLSQHLQSVQQCMQAIQQPQQRLTALKSLRHVLEQHPTPSVIPILAELITSDSEEDADIVEESIWCLNVLAHGYDALSVIEIAPTLLHRLKLGLPGQKAACWTVANLAADNPGNRHRLRALGAIDIVLNVLQDAKSVEMGRIAAWALCNLIRGQNPPDELRTIVQSRLPAVLIQLADDALKQSRLQILAELLWIFTYLTAGDQEHSQNLLVIGLGSILSRTLRRVTGVVPDQDRAANDALLAALRCVGNVVSGPDSIAEKLLNEGDFINDLGQCLDGPSPAIIKEAMWALSNISGGPPNRALEICQADLLPKIVNLFRSGTFDIQKECGFALYNLARIEIVFHRIWNCQVLDQFLNLMRSRDGEAVELGFKFVKLALRQVPGDGAVQALRDNDAQAILEDIRLVREDLQPEANAIIDQYLDPLDNEDLVVPDPDVSYPPASYPPWRIGAHRHS